jgi:hypothetical protein
VPVDVVGKGITAVDVAAAIVVIGGGFVAVTAGEVVIAGVPGTLVVTGGAVLDTQLKTAVNMKKDRTKNIKALPVTNFFTFTVRFTVK